MDWLICLGIFLAVCLLGGWCVSKLMLSIRRSNTSSYEEKCINERLPSVVKVDDKNWIVDGKIESFETDTPLLRMQQETEDNKHYRAFERAKLKRDRDSIYNDWRKTVDAIKEHSFLRDCITEEALKDITEKYDKYIYKCDKLDRTIRLTKEEYLIHEKHPFFCVDWSTLGIWIPPLVGNGCYNIYNTETARYSGGDMNKKIEQEFKKEWY